MDATGPISFQRAERALAAQRAYAPRPTPQAAAVSRVNTPVTAGSVDATAGAARLVAGKVSVPADPALASNGGSSMGPSHLEAGLDAGSRASGGAFAMYTRSADRVEVATRVALGQQIDRRG